MKRLISRSAVAPILMALGFVLLDFAMDRLFGEPLVLTLPHLVLTGSVVVAVYISMSRTLVVHRETAIALQQAHDELEAHVRDRTAALRASEEKYRLLFQNMVDGFALCELLYDDQGNPVDWQVLEVNDAYQRHTGIAPEQVVGKRISEVFPGAVPEYLPQFATVVATQTPIDFETYAVAIGRYQRVSSFPAGNHRFANIIEDLTERKRADEALIRTRVELAQQVQERTKAEERQRLARELHDSVSQALYGISLGANTALKLFDTDRATVLEALNHVLTLSRSGLTEMRSVILALRSETLEIDGLCKSLVDQAAALHARLGAEVDVTVCDEPDVSLSAKEALYRITQEALNNAAKHASATRVDVRLIQGADHLTLEVCDDGVGFDPLADFPNHVGLKSMRERATVEGGTLDIISAPGRGTRICARIPL